MSNQEKLKNYLLGDKSKDGYLKREISNGKVIMLSGKWGSGKTHFWQKEIIPNLNNKEEKIPNHYISLYGKTSIEEIKSEIFLKLFESVDSFKSEEKTKNIVKNSIDTALSLANSISVFGISLDLSKISDKSFEKIDDLLENEKLKRTEEYLNSGAIICFDDFERKSKDIDLNDLFGFITQLTLNFKCKVVIILNDDVFEGEEKDIFSKVKEKTVSKYLKYEPSIEELFNLIFDNNYEVLKNYSDMILKTFEESEVLNARIYMQVLDNLKEWIEDNKADKNNVSIKYFIITNINFIERHKVFIIKEHGKGIVELKGFYNPYSDYISFNIRNIDINFDIFLTSIKNEIYLRQENTNERVANRRKTFSEKEINEMINFIDMNTIHLTSLYFGKKFLQDSYIEEKQVEKINTFIETGILED
ncbi:P-loop NTPase fold protein [Arcobacter sp. YIC-464]|uniref:P-loop NTPase fold protein n=1 Tax=Arcobacter sp. YIC-464 TaxID=3376631 RepID=UPI003C27A6FE